MSSLKWVVLVLGALVAQNSWANGVSEPEHCWEKLKAPCAYRATKFEWKTWQTWKFRVGPGTSFLISEDQSVQVLEGNIWVEAHEPVKFRFQNRRFEIQGEAWIKRQADRLTMLNFQGNVKVLGDFQSEVLPAGFENWWGLAHQGIMRPFVLKAALFEWNSWLKLDRKAAQEKVQNYRSDWESRFEVSGDFYQQVIERRFASVESRQDRAYQRKVQQKKEQEHFRQMFRDRYLGH